MELDPVPALVSQYLLRHFPAPLRQRQALLWRFPALSGGFAWLFGGQTTLSCPIVYLFGSETALPSRQQRRKIIIHPCFNAKQSSSMIKLAGFVARKRDTGTKHCCGVALHSCFEPKQCVSAAGITAMKSLFARRQPQSNASQRCHGR
ncbi:MAG: hypothetical protein M3Z64_08215 [Verrucomicrobiota bacterium]|nr:hypothetical protein [Verrucomicrobiota bacterium]